MGSVSYTHLGQRSERAEMNMKKLFLLNLPYLLFVYPFHKLAQAFRLAPGSDLSGKLLSIGDGFTAAFSSPWLSFHPVSYTHLDVYKRQPFRRTCAAFLPAVSGTVGKGLERETLCLFPRLRGSGTHYRRCAQIRNPEF